MWTYNSPNELYHWGIKKGEQKQNHKYIKREWKNGRWVYYYDKKENELTRLKSQKEYLERTNNAKFENFYNRRRQSDIANAKGNARVIENVNRWYSDPGIKKGTRDVYESYGKNGWFDKQEEKRASYAVDKRSKSVGGIVDSFMEKNGKDIASKLNAASSYVQEGKTKIDKILKYNKTLLRR